MNNGTFHVLRPTDEGPNVQSVTQLEGNCLGAPAIAGGRVYVHTTDRLYCFGAVKSEPAWPAAEPAPAPSAAVRARAVPLEVVTRPGDEVKTRLQAVDEHGNVISRALTLEKAQDRPGIQTIEHDYLGMTATQNIRVVPALRTARTSRRRSSARCPTRTSRSRRRSGSAPPRSGRS